MMIGLSSAVMNMGVRVPSHSSAGLYNILELGLGAGEVDRTGHADASGAFTAAILATNKATGYNKARLPSPACIYVPSGVYLLDIKLPAFEGAGCIKGDGSSQTVINLGPHLGGDVFSWQDAWIALGTSGPTVSGLRINGAPDAIENQNALVFYGRNDNITLDDVYISKVAGRAIGLGLLPKFSVLTQSYVRESHLRNIWIFNCGTNAVPAFEITSQGVGLNEDGTNEISISQLDIYGSSGTSLLIHNESRTGTVRDLKFDALRIEGREDGQSQGDLLQIGDSSTFGGIGQMSFTNLELINPSPGHAALHINSGVPSGNEPSRIFLQGFVGGGASRGSGLQIESGSYLQIVLNQIHTSGMNVRVGSRVRSLSLDGGGAERYWTYAIDPISRPNVLLAVHEKFP